MARHQPKPDASHFYGSGQYVRQIIKCLEQINACSGEHPRQVFSDWTELVEVSFEMLPTHLTAMAQTGQLAEDTPEAQEVFARIRARYRTYHHSSNIWRSFSEALTILIESAKPGLWGPGSYGNFDVGYMGPDVLGHIYTLYANAGQAQWNMQIFTPWNVALMAARCVIPDGERQVHDRLKQACQHPDNLLAQATLLAGLTIDEPEQAQEWFFNRVLPAAWSTYEPITVGDPAGCGSGVLLLAGAACFPAWAVRLRCVVFQGIDNDALCVRLSRLNCMLYALNGYALKFVEALEPLTLSVKTSTDLTRSQADACRQAVTLSKDHGPTSSPVVVPTFADLYRRQLAESKLEV